MLFRSYDWLDNFGRRSPRRADPSLTDLAVGQSFMTIFELTDFTDGESLTLRMKAGRPTRIFGAITLHYRVETITGSRGRLVAALWMPPIGRGVSRSVVSIPAVMRLGWSAAWVGHRGIGFRQEPCEGPHDDPPPVCLVESVAGTS